MPADIDNELELIDPATRYSLEEFCSVSRVQPALVIRLVEEGILLAEGDSPDGWYFSVTMVKRLQVACRLRRDLELDPAGLALAVELLDEISSLKQEIGRLRNRLEILG